MNCSIWINYSRIICHFFVDITSNNKVLCYQHTINFSSITHSSTFYSHFELPPKLRPAMCIPSDVHGRTERHLERRDDSTPDKRQNTQFDCPAVPPNGHSDRDDLERVSTATCFAEGQHWTTRTSDANSLTSNALLPSVSGWCRRDGWMSHQ